MFPYCSRQHENPARSELILRAVLSLRVVESDRCSMSALAIWRESRIHSWRHARLLSPIPKTSIAELPAQGSFDLRAEQNRVSIEKRE
jgi:hypothetical protein